MRPVFGGSRVGAVLVASLLAVLVAAGPARAATTVSSEAHVGFTPGQPADNSLRLIVRVGEDVGGTPGVTERMTVYLPREVALQDGSFARCSIDTVRALGVESCPGNWQLGSGTVKGALVPQGSVFAFDALVVNGSAPGAMIFHLRLPGTLVQIALEGQLVPSDDPGFGSMLVVPIAAELQQPVAGVYFALTELDVTLHANAAAPYVAIAGCPLGLMRFRTVLSFNQLAPAAPAGPLSTAAEAPCMLTPVEEAIGEFRVRLERIRGKLRRLRLFGVPAESDVSVLCLRRCGGRGDELTAARRGSSVRLERALRPRSRFEVRVAMPERVARFARYRVKRQGRSPTLVGSGCLDSAGARRDCPA